MTTSGSHASHELSVNETGRLNASPVLVAQASKVILAATTFSLVAIPLLTPMDKWVLTAVAVLPFMLLYWIAWKLAERNRAKWGAHLFLWGTWVGQVGVLLNTAGLTHQALVSGVNLVLAAGFMMGRQAAAIAGLICTFTLVFFQLAWMVNLFPPALLMASESMSSVALLGTIMGTVGLTYIGIHYMTGAITSAREHAERAEVALASLKVAREAEVRRATRAERLSVMARSLVSLREPDAIAQEVTISLRDALDAHVVMALGRAGRMLAVAGLGDHDPPDEISHVEYDEWVPHGEVAVMQPGTITDVVEQLNMGEAVLHGMVARAPNTFNTLVVLCKEEFVPNQLAWSVQVTVNLMDAAMLRMESEYRTVQAQKMDALGRLSAGIAHDFNNLLTTILGGAELIQNKADATDPIQHRLRNIRTAGERAAALTSKLMTFTRSLPRRRRIVDCTEVLGDLMPVVRRTVEENIEIEFHEMSEDVWVDADPIDLERIILNLVANARDAVGHTGRIDVGLDSRKIDGQEQPVAVLWVQDNGEGMDMNTRSRVFEPFFTTRRGKGATGLGLSIVYGVAQALGGDVFIDSMKSKGTCVEVHMPQVSPVDRTQPSRDTPLESANGAMVLVVEDDPDVRETVCELLELGGYAALPVPSAREALRVLGEDASIRLVLSDVVMPEMGGLGLAAAMAAEGIDTPLALISGYAPGQVEQGENGSDIPRITKPFSLSELLVFVAQNVSPEQVNDPA